MATASHRFLADWLGTAPATEQGALDLVEAGLPNSVVQRFLDQGLTRAEVFDVILPLRTWKHRRSRRQALTPGESERAVRAAYRLAQAQAVWGGREAALRWMRTPKRRFHGRAPMQLLATEPGGRLVEQMLVQIDEGIFA